MGFSDGPKKISQHALLLITHVRYRVNYYVDLKGMSNQAPHRDEWVARSEWKKSLNHMHNFTFSLRISHSWRYQELRTYQLAAESLPYLAKVLPHYYISMPYWPNLTNKFAIPYVCLYHFYVPAVHSCPNELCNIHGDTHATIKVTVQIRTRAVSVDTFDTNPLRIIRSTNWWYYISRFLSSMSQFALCVSHPYTQLGMVCKDSYVIRAVRLIRNAQHTNRVSALCAVCAGAYVSDCNSTDPART